MNGLSFFVGLMQTSVVLFVAGLLLRILRTRDPAAAVRVGTVGLCGSLLLMLLYWMDAPRLWVTQLELRSSQAQVVMDGSTAAANSGTEGNRNERERRHAMGDSSRSTAISKSHDGSEQESYQGLPLLRMLSALRTTDFSAQSDAASTSNATRVVSWAGAAVAAWMVILGFGIVVGILATVHLHHSGVRISSDEWRRRFPNQCQGVEKRFIESSWIHAPCVTCYGGRTIYLPQDWRRWPAEQLAISIDHERAHLLRRDPWGRFFANVCMVIQCANPFAWWVYRGVVLSQEMAADRKASDGQSINYARNLGRLALRLDAPRRSGTAEKRRLGFFEQFLGSGFVSVSSNHLIRRIEMLTKYPLGSGMRRLRVFAVVCTVSMTVGFAAWTVQADPPTTPEESDGALARSAEERSAASTSEAGIPVERVAALPRRGEQAEPSLFQEEAFQPWDRLEPSETGFAALRVDRLLKHPAFQDSVPDLVNPVLEFGWRTFTTDDAGPNRESLGLGLDNIDHVIAAIDFSVSKTEREEGDSDNNSELKLSSDGGLVRFKEAVQHDPIRAAISVPKVVQLLISNGVKRDEHPGGLAINVFAEEILDGVFTDGSTTNELGFPLSDDEVDTATFRRIQQAWNAVDGGMAAASFTLPSTLGFVEDKRDRHADQILSHAASMGVGIDVPDSGPAQIRIAFVPRSGVEAEQLQRKLDAGFDLLKRELNERGADSEESEASQAVMRKQALAILDSSMTATIKVEINSDGVESGAVGLEQEAAETDDKGEELECVLMTFEVPLESLLMLSML